MELRNWRATILDGNDIHYEDPAGDYYASEDQAWQEAVKLLKAGNVWRPQAIVLIQDIPNYDLFATDRRYVIRDVVRNEDGVVMDNCFGPRKTINQIKTQKLIQHLVLVTALFSLLIIFLCYIVSLPRSPHVEQRPEAVPSERGPV